MVVHECCDHTTKSQETLKMENGNEMEKENNIAKKSERNGE